MEAIWHDDGHVLHLRLERSVLVVDAVVCPHGVDAERPCAQGNGCVVEWFVGVYGLDCHVGVCPPRPALEVAWTLVGEPGDLDAAQVWVISTDDEAFAAWLTSQRQA